MIDATLLLGMRSAASKNKLVCISVRPCVPCSAGWALCMGPTTRTCVSDNTHAGATVPVVVRQQDYLTRRTTLVLDESRLILERPPEIGRSAQ